MKILQIIKENTRRKLLDWSRKKLSINTVIDQLFLDLQVQKFLPKKIEALDLFARNGLWLSKDYEEKVDYLELCEIDEFYHNWSKKAIKANSYNLGDSIKMLEENQMKKDKYNFILSDNFSGKFGPYTEHFEVFDYIFDYIDSGIIAFNVVPNTKSRIKYYPENKQDYDDWLAKRSRFYNLNKNEVEVLSIQTLKDIYKTIITNKGYHVKYFNHLVRNDVVTLFYFVIEKTS